VAEYDWGQMHKDATTALEGEFPLVIVEAIAGKTNAGDKDMIKFKAKVESGPYVDRPIWGQFVISPESPVAMRILFSHLASLGMDSAFFAKNPRATTEQLAQALVNRRAIGVIGSRQWNGQDREEIQQWKPALGGSGGSTSLGTLGGFNGGVGTPSATPATTPGVPSTPATAPGSTPSVPTSETPGASAPKLPF
jgi:hypothetical protein